MAKIAHLGCWLSLKEQDENGGCPVIRLTLDEATMIVHVLDDDFRFADPMITKARIWELARKLESKALEVKAQQEKHSVDAWDKWNRRVRK